MAEPDTTSTPDGSPGSAAPWRAFAHPLTLVLMAGAVAASFVARFFVTSPLWLDEALSVNIAKLPLGSISDALRHDGHPPLYYVLLHGWMSLFGESDHAVRALSGLITVATLPLAYLVGRRIGGRRLGYTTALVFALSPYAFRYGSETRMYALLMAEVFAGYLLITAAIAAPKLRTLAGIAVTTGLLLWTHYWSMWLIAAIGVLAVVRLARAQRRGDRELVAGSLKILAAMAVGALTFVPWVPNLLYQSAHTGTPWAKSFRITNLIVTSLTEFAGGPYSEAQIGMLLLVILVVIGIFGTGIDHQRIELDFFAHPLARRPLSVLALTAVIASVVALANGMGFSPRYAAVYFPFFVILVALGLDQFRSGVVREVVLVAFVATALAGIGFVLRLDRTEAGVATDAIRAAAPTGVVIACPDQLGPSVARLLDEQKYDVTTYPRFAAPERVDWVDYKERNAKNDPAKFGADLLKRAEGKALFIVVGDNFLTLEGQCQKVVETVAGSRPARTIVLPSTEKFYEPMAVIEFDPPK
ncbi:MAG: glycosyltransferase family 39 protein [Acidimicrobiales bacterium]